MKDTTGLFNACMNHVPVEGHYRSCVMDVCNNHGKKRRAEELSCNAIAIMAKECTDKGVELETWDHLPQCSKYTVKCNYLMTSCHSLFVHVKPVSYSCLLGFTLGMLFIVVVCF